MALYIGVFVACAVFCSWLLKYWQHKKIGKESMKHLPGPTALPLIGKWHFFRFYIYLNTLSIVLCYILFFMTKYEFSDVETLF